MFGAEPQEKWTVQEAIEFEAEAARDLHQKLIRAGWATAVFIGTVLAITLFLYGHSLHAYWERIGKYLVIVAMGELLWIVLWWGFVYASGRAHERFGARWQTWSDCLQTFASPELALPDGFVTRRSASVERGKRVPQTQRHGGGGAVSMHSEVQQNAALQRKKT